MSLGNLQFKNRRKHLRFDPGPNSIVAISLSHEENSGTGFHSDFVGLPLSESYKGCSMVIRLNPDITKDRVVLVKLGELNPLLARVAWIRSLNEELSEVGLQFLE